MNFVSGASGSNITDLKFLNTQVFVNTSQNIVFDNITAENSQPGLGQGTGSFAIRDGSINITVKNSDFITTSNGGYSTLVLTWAKDCTIDNNTITGTGNVGNLVYLNNYGGSTNANGITKNSNNIISNNTITATNNGVFCYSLAISGPNNIIINNEISNGFMYAVTTTWAGSYDTETDPEDTHNVSYYGNKYINNTITGRFSTGNYSEVINNTVNGISTIVGHADVTGNEFLNTVTLYNDINFKENDASTVTVNVNLPNGQFKDNNISVLTISSNAEPTYNYGGNNIGTINGNFVTATTSNSNSQTESNTNILTKNTSNLKRATPTERNVDYHYGTWIDDDTWEVNVTEDNYSGIFGNKNSIWWKNTRGKNITFNVYYLPSDKELTLKQSSNVTVHFKNNITLNNELYTSALGGNGTFYSDGNITITCDEDYFYLEYDEYGYISSGRGLDPILRFAGNSTVKNLVYNINITEDMLSTMSYLYENDYTAISGDNLTLEDCTFNIQLPRNIKVYQSGFDSVNYTVQLLGSDTGDHFPRIGNFTIKNCIFNINSSAETEDDYPYLFSDVRVISDELRTNIDVHYPYYNLDILPQNHNITFINNTINLNNLKGIQVSSDGAIIENNTIITNNNYAVELLGNSNTVKNNVLIAKELKGNDAVLVTGENNIVENNGPQDEVVEPTINITTTEFTPGQTATITASIYNGEEVDTTVNKGKVSFKVNGKTLKDANGKVIYAKVTNGIATINDYLVPESWSEGSTIQAIYSGSKDLAKMSSEKIEITLTKPEPTLTTEEISSSVASTVTLKATVNTTVPVNIGKVVFKINGKSLKDANGKVIYAKIVNNTVSVEYVLPEEYKEGLYNITAVFISPDYNRIEDTKTLTVTS